MRNALLFLAGMNLGATPQLTYDGHVWVAAMTLPVGVGLLFIAYDLYWRRGP